MSLWAADNVRIVYRIRWPDGVANPTDFGYPNIDLLLIA